LCVESGGGANLTGVCSEDIDALLYAQASTVNLGERVTLFFQLEALNQDAVWWVPLCALSDIWLGSGRVQSAHPWRGAPFWDAWRW
jgi:ABC-type oligopeptide transport system substrate-binding subunit